MKGPDVYCYGSSRTCSIDLSNQVWFVKYQRFQGRFRVYLRRCAIEKETLTIQPHTAHPVSWKFSFVLLEDVPDDALRNDTCRRKPIHSLSGNIELLAFLSLCSSGLQSWTLDRFRHFLSGCTKARVPNYFRVQLDGWSCTIDFPDRRSVWATQSDSRNQTMRHRILSNFHFWLVCSRKDYATVTRDTTQSKETTEKKSKMMADCWVDLKTNVLKRLLQDTPTISTQ